MVINTAVGTGLEKSITSLSPTTSSEKSKIKISGSLAVLKAYMSIAENAKIVNTTPGIPRVDNVSMRSLCK